MHNRISRVFMVAALAALLVAPAVAFAQEQGAPAEPPRLVPQPTADSPNGVAPAPGPQGPAQTNGPAGPEGADPDPPANRGIFGDSSFLIMVVGLLGLMVLMSVLSSRNRKKQQTRQRTMIESIKKGDKIVTIGGVLGTVIENRDNQITVKVDEQNNIRMTFAKWAVRAVGEEAKSVTAPEESR